MRASGGTEVGLRAGSYVVLDFETTGLSPTRHEVVETGAVHVDAGRVGSSFHELSRPRRAIPEAATHIHGISNDDLTESPPFADVFPALIEFLGDRVLVAHHARFDTSFLRREALLSGRVPPENPVICTVRLSRRLFPELQRHDLESLCRHHGIPRRARHRALEDAEATAWLLDVLVERAAESGVASVKELCELGRPPGPRARTVPVRLGDAERDRLEDAIVTGDAVSLHYVSRRGIRSRRDVVPYVVDWVGASLRLVAYDLKAGTTRTFRLDRVLAIAGAGEESP